MHPALFKLLMLVARSNLRRLFRGARTPRGAFLIVFTIGIFTMMLAPSIFVAAVRNRPGVFPVGIAGPYLSVGLLLIALLFVFTSAGEKALYFSPSEVDFLFPAPFDRRELLIFKLAKTLVGLVFMALVFSASFLIYLGSWLPAFVGLFLTLAFVQLLAMTMAFLSQIVAEHAYTLRQANRSAVDRGHGLGRAGADVVADAHPESVRVCRAFPGIMDRDGAAGAF